MTSISRRSLIRLGLATGVLALAASPARALVQIVVSGANFVPLPIAIPDFSSADPTFGTEIADIVRADLKRSGLFAPADPATLPAHVGDVAREPDFNAWRATNVDALVMGQVDRAGAVNASVRLWDTQAAQQMVGKSYSTGADSYRRIAHIVADSIYESLTSGGGYFDTRVLYVAESGPKANRVKKLAIMDQDGANIQYLSSGKSLTLGPRLSPDGQSVVFTSYEDGNPQVYVSSLGGAAKRLVPNAPMSFAPRFTPDGQSVVFSVSNGDATNLYQVGLGGGRPVQLTDGAVIDTSPSYSPDGTRIVFESDRGGTQQIYIMNAAGGGAQRISFGNGRYSTPVWAPVGDLIAFTRQSGDGFQIGTMKPDGSGERILSSSGFVQESPSWAPNGRVIMFDRDPGGDGGPSLYSVDIWGRNEIKIPTETYASDPSWSPLRG
jgi:TolB protein